MVEKGIFPYVSKQESAINAGESFQVGVIQHILILYFEILVLYILYRISSMFMMKTWVTWSVFDVLNRSDRLTGFI